ncbi:MAG: type II toxin-antitoxin system RelE family toxin [Candidatus Nanoarchaeia archaeon]
MAYTVEISEGLDKKFLKLRKKNPQQLRIIFKKIYQIKHTPYHFKPLRGSLKNVWRVHIDKHFVLTYTILESSKTIRFLDFAHHDVVYE